MRGAWLPAVCRGEAPSAKTWAGRTPGWLEPSEEEGQESDLMSASWAGCALCSCHTHPSHLALSWEEKGSLGRERLPFNPKFASSVALGQEVLLSEPQFLHLSNGLVIPFCMVVRKEPDRFQNRVLTPRSILLPSPGPPRRACCTLMVSRRRCRFH